MELTFGENAVEHMLDIFDCTENENGLLLDASDEIVTDSGGNSVPVCEIGGFISLGYDSPFSRSTNGRVLHNGETITEQNETKDVLVPIDDKTAVLRDDISSLAAYIDCIE